MTDRSRTRAAVVAGILAGILMTGLVDSSRPGDSDGSSVAAGEPSLDGNEIFDGESRQTDSSDEEDITGSTDPSNGEGETAAGGTVTPDPSAGGPALVDPSAGAPQPEDDSGSAPVPVGPSDVAGLADLLDALETGSAVGPGVINGIILTIVGSQNMPPPGDQVQAVVIDAVITIGQQISGQSPQALHELRELLSPLACQNDSINAGIDVIAGSLERGADTFGEVLAPFDLTARETATFLRGFQASQPGDC